MEDLFSLRRKRVIDPEDPTLSAKLNVLDQRLNGAKRASFTGGLGILALNIYTKHSYADVSIPLGILNHHIPLYYRGSVKNFYSGDDYLFAFPFKYARLFKALVQYEEKYKNKEELPWCISQARNAPYYPLGTILEQNIEIKKKKRFKRKHILKARTYLFERFNTWYSNKEALHYKSIYFPKNYDIRFLNIE